MAVARVRMVVGLSGTRNGADWPPIGGEVTLPDSEAADLVAAGLAVAVAAPVESAAVDTKPVTRKRPAEKRG